MLPSRSRKAMHWERADEHKEVLQQLGISVGDAAAAAAATEAAAAAGDLAFLSEPGAAGAAARERWAHAAAAAALASKSDPGSAN